MLITKVDHLISQVESQNKQTKENTETLNSLKAHFDKIDANMKGYEVMKREFEEMKSNKSLGLSIIQPSKVPIVTSNTAPMAPPVPPPPPPPPPPLPLLSLPKLSNNLKIVKTVKNEKKSDTFNRPVISEDAIRQVKLKKISVSYVKKYNTSI